MLGRNKNNYCILCSILYGLCTDQLRSNINTVVEPDMLWGHITLFIKLLISTLI